MINASGVILHTNLGRAPLPAQLIEDLRRTATQYTNLEYDLDAGARGKRDVHTARLLQRLTGAESTIVVNNCAAAVLLTLAALARGGEVIVSRGELIEIGDGFRIPEIMEQSGAVLREVGTTNRTRLADYEHAISEKTRVLLRVHPSNFQVTGFTEKPDVAELVALGQRANLPVVEDLGSGCLVDLSAHGITEPTARESISAGFSLVLFSGVDPRRSSSRDHRGAERTGRQSSPPSTVPRASRGQANHHRSGMHSARLSARRLGGSAFPAHDSPDH